MSVACLPYWSGGQQTKTFPSPLPKENKDFTSYQSSYWQVGDSLDKQRADRMTFWVWLRDFPLNPNSVWELSDYPGATSQYAKNILQFAIFTFPLTKAMNLYRHLWQVARIQRIAISPRQAAFASLGGCLNWENRYKPFENLKDYSKEFLSSQIRPATIQLTMATWGLQSIFVVINTLHLLWFKCWLDSFANLKTLYKQWNVTGRHYLGCFSSLLWEGVSDIFTNCSCIWEFSSQETSTNDFIC